MASLSTVQFEISTVHRLNNSSSSLTLLSLSLFRIFLQETILSATNIVSLFLDVTH